MSIGLLEARLFPEGLGARDPIAANANAVGRARNRRVEIVVQSTVVSETLANAGLDKTPTTTIDSVKPGVQSGVSPGVSKNVAPVTADVAPQLGAP